jgi:integrase
MAKIPKYRRHSARNLGFVEVNKKRIYFAGKFNSPESLTEYGKFITSLAGSKKPNSDLRATRGDEVPIRLLVAQFLEWAKYYYVKHGRPTGTYERFRDYDTPPLLELFGDTATDQFGPLDLKRVRQKLLDDFDLCRNEINDRISRIKRVFSWGVENELVPESVAGSLHYVKSLQEGKTTARESKPVTSVPQEIVDQTLPMLPPTLDDMVRIQCLTGCRPSEICNIRWQDIDQSDAECWIYTPFEHKNEHKKKTRHVGFTAKAQKILEKYRHRPVDEFIFCPAETMRIVFERRKPNQTKPKKLKRQKKHSILHEKYTTRAYGQAVRNAAKKANVPKWSPNQTRHLFATNAENKTSREIARILLGHENQSTTGIYIDETVEKVKQAAKLLDN